MTGRGPYKPRRAVKKPRTLGERLVVLRQALHLSQAGLAKVLGVPQQSVSSWERGITEPSGPAMALLTTTLGITEKALQTGEKFVIPEELPSQEGRGGQHPGLDRGYMAVEDGSRKPIALPTAAPGEVWGVDAASGQNIALTKEQALAWLAEAIQNDDPVWIVVKGNLKGRRTKSTPGRRSKA